MYYGSNISFLFYSGSLCVYARCLWLVVNADSYLSGVDVTRHWRVLALLDLAYQRVQVHLLAVEGRLQRSHLNQEVNLAREMHS